MALYKKSSLGESGMFLYYNFCEDSEFVLYYAFTYLKINLFIFIYLAIIGESLNFTSGESQYKGLIFLLTRVGPVPPFKPTCKTLQGGGSLQFAARL